MNREDIARRIVSNANGWVGAGQDGYLAFDPDDGSGGAFYTRDVSVNHLRASGCLVVPVPETRPLRVGDVLDMLEEEGK